MFVPGEKPSNMEGNATMDMSNGSVSQGGSTGSKFSQSNRDMSSRALGAIGFLTDKVKGMLNVSASGSVQVGVGNRDGIYYRVNGEGHGYGRNEKGFNDLTRDALLDTLHKLLVGNEATVNASKGIDGTTIEEIFAGVAKVAEVTNNGRASASQDIASRRLDFSGHFDQAIEELRWVRDVYDNIVSGEYTKGLSSYLKGVQDLNTNWTGLIAHAEALGLATEKLSEAWAAATAELKDARDSKLQSLDTSITSRALKLNGNVGDNLKADVADYQAKAREEMLQVKSSYRDLGLSPQEMAASISALGDIQARELAAILQKYADSASQWVANTYNALTGRTNQFAQSMESLVTQFDAAIYMAKQLGISETDLVAARTTAIADLLYQRDLQARGLHDGLSIRSLKMVGTDAANLTADLMTSDLNALQEKLTFKKSLVDLGLTSAQVGAEMVRLEAVQADERLAIIKKYNDAVLQAEAERQSKAQIAVMDMANGVRDYVHTLRTGDSSPLSEATKYDIARMDFNTASDKATTGDWNSIATLKDYASSFIDASRTYNGSGTTFVADFDRAIAALQAVAEQTPDTLTASFLAQATQTQTTTLVESLTAVKEEITALRREVRQQSLTPERVAA
jgi:hypothetical protein